MVWIPAMQTQISDEVTRGICFMVRLSPGKVGLYDCKRRPRGTAQGELPDDRFVQPCVMARSILTACAVSREPRNR